MAIEAIVLKALGEKAQKPKEDRQAFLRRLATTANGMWFDTEDDGTEIEPTEEANAIWEKMGKTDDGEAAQTWINAAVEVDKGDEIPDFPDIEPEGSEDEAEDEAGNEAGDETETEDETMLARNEETETETKTSKKAKANAKKPVLKTKATKAAEKEKPAKKAAAKANGKDKAPAKAAKPANKKTGRKEGGPSGYTTIRALMMKDMNTKTPALIEKLEAKGYKLSRNAVSVIRANFLQTCTELNAAGCIKNLKLPG